MNEQDKLTVQVKALEYLVKILFAIQFERMTDPVGAASGFAENISQKLERTRPNNVDEETHMEVTQVLGRILDDLVAEMKLAG